MPPPTTRDELEHIDRPLRVLQVVEATISGVKRHVLDLLEDFAQRPELEVEVACPPVREDHGGDVAFVAEARALGIRVHPISMRRSIDARQDLAALLALARLIRHGRYDVVHLHSSKAGGLGRTAASLAFLDAPARRPRVVYTPNGFAFLLPGRRRRAYIAIERILGRLTDRLIVVSDDERQEALRHTLTSPDHIRLVRNGVDPGRLPAPGAGDAKRLELGWGLRGSCTVVGAVARMSQQKDPLTWLRSVALVAERRPDLRFVWVMGGELEPEVRALARELALDRDDRVQFLGYRRDACEIIAAMDVFTLSSIFEGLSYVVMEAMALQRAIVATTASRELIRDGVTGLVVPPRDAAGLARGMVRLADDPVLRRGLGRAARQLVLNQCTTERQTAQTRRIYAELLPARGTAAAGRGRP